MLTFLGALVAAGITLLLGWQIRSYQLRESESRADPSLNIHVGTRVLTVSEATRILEVRIEVKNNSRKTCCIPAVYVSARALVGDGLKESYTGESDFSKLEDCGSLSNIRNVARMEHTVLQVAPDEVERFVRWDTLDADFFEKYRVIVVNVEVFGASADLVGEQRYKYKQGEYRLDWIRYMNDDGGFRNNYVVFARWPATADADKETLRPGRRYLCLPGNKGPDLKNTRKFEEVLSTVVKWNRHTTVSLSQVPGVVHPAPPSKSSAPTAS